MNLTLVLIIVAGVAALIVAGIIISFFSVWLRARLAGAPVSMLNLVAMRLRQVPYSLVTDARITARKAGIDISIDEIEAHAAAIEPYVRVDFWSLFGAFFGKELSPDAADWRNEDDRFPLLATMQARAEDLKEQFAAIDQGSFPRGPHIGVGGDNEAWEPCADWRAAEANRSKCEQGCMYDGCHRPDYTVESFCNEETGLCLHGDYDEQCAGIFDEERYPGMKDTEDGRQTFCLFAKGVPVKAAECPAPGAAMGSLSSGNNGEGSGAQARHRMILWSLASGLTFIAILVSH